MHYEPGTHRTAWRLILALGCLHLLFSFFVNPQGYLTYDSGTYHFMARTFATTGSFVPWNGYEEFPSPELVVGQLRAQPSGRLASQYPELLSVLAWPFYALFGYPGLFLLNAVAFLGINLLLYRLALLLFERSSVALSSLVVYSFGTFAWEYSQSSYPHLSSTFFVLLGVDAAARAILLPTGRPIQALVSGLAFGAAMGVRLDSLFALPAPILVFLLARPTRWREMLALVAGLLPGLGFLAWSNNIKFGSPFPFSYGVRDAMYISDLTWYLPVAAAGLGVVAMLFLGRLFVGWRLAARHRGRAMFAVLALALLAAAVFSQQVLGFLAQLADGAWQIVVDLRIRNLEIREPALRRSENGAMIYLGGVKKSLLQSCPYLAVLPFALWTAARREKKRLTVALLLVVPASYLGFFSYLAWHGSIALNMRYLNPALPFFALLTAGHWQRISRRLEPRRVGLIFILVLLGGIAVFEGRFRVDQQEWLFLDTPLLLAAGVFALEMLRSLGRLSKMGQSLAAWLLTVTIAFSGSVAFARDYPAAAAHRRQQLLVTEQLVPLVAPDSMVFTNMPDICWGLLEIDRVRIARPDLDGYATFAALTEFHLRGGRPVYLALTPGQFEQARKRHVFDAFALEIRKAWMHGERPAFALWQLRLRPIQS